MKQEGSHCLTMMTMNTGVPLCHRFTSVNCVIIGSCNHLEVCFALIQSLSQWWLNTNWTKSFSIFTLKKTLFKEMHWKIFFAKHWPLCWGSIVLNITVIEIAKPCTYLILNVSDTLSSILHSMSWLPSDPMAWEILDEVHNTARHTLNNPSDYISQHIQLP